MGAGRIVVLGDNLALTNEGLVRSHRWTAQLLSYLVHRSSGPQATWRQLLSLLLCLGVLAWTVRGGLPRLVAVPVLLAIFLSVCGWASQQSARVVPNGHLARHPQASSANRLAYIGASHLEAFSDADWSLDGINGIALTLMRHGYLALALSELDPERLAQAAILVSIAPARPLTREDNDHLVEFVEGGGTLVCTVGAEQAAGSRSLLARFGMHVPVSPVPTSGNWSETEPMGHFPHPMMAR